MPHLQLETQTECHTFVVWWHHHDIIRHHFLMMSVNWWCVNSVSDPLTGRMKTVRRVETLLLTDTHQKLRTSVKTGGGGCKDKPRPLYPWTLTGNSEAPPPLPIRKNRTENRNMNFACPSVLVSDRQTGISLRRGRERLLPLSVVGGAELEGRGTCGGGVEVLAAVADATSQTA